MTIEKVSADFLQTKILRIARVHGGDINEAYSLTTEKGLFFLKVNKADEFPEMFVKEKNGLEALKNSSKLRVPHVLGVQEAENKQFLFLEFIERGNFSPTFWEDFGRGLAYQHRQTSTNFGWEIGNYMGNLRQQNDWTASWSEFFSSFRILPLIKVLLEKKLVSVSVLRSTETLCGKLDEIFPDEAPSLIHGDLWSGNYMVDEAGKPVLIDPAVSYSHREMDLGMTKLFGGFSDQFYDSYDEEYPIENGWKERLPLSQLYPLLIHAVLFGGSYVSSCKNIIEKF